MKTIVHIITTDEERRRLYCVWNGTESKKMVSRADIVARCETHIREELDQYEKPTPETTPAPEPAVEAAPESGPEIWERDAADDSTLRPICKRILSHIALGRDDGTWNPGYVESLIRATGLTE